MRRSISLLLAALGLFVVPGLASAQIHPATSALATDSVSLAPAILGVQPQESTQQNPTLYGPTDNYEGATMFQANFDYSWTQFQAFGQSLNGFQGSFTMFLHEIGLEGTYLGELGTHDGQNSRLTFAGGGVHVRFRTTSQGPTVGACTGRRGALSTPNLAWGQKFLWLGSRRRGGLCVLALDFTSRRRRCLRNTILPRYASEPRYSRRNRLQFLGFRVWFSAVA